jgi:hypothetical protein
MMRFQSPPRADSLNHTPVPHVNNLPSELIGGKIRLDDLSCQFFCYYFVMLYIIYYS